MNQKPENQPQPRPADANGIARPSHADRRSSPVAYEFKGEAIGTVGGAFAPMTGMADDFARRGNRPPPYGLGRLRRLGAYPAPPGGLEESRAAYDCF